MRKKLIILCTIGILMITACGKNKDTQQAQTEDNKQTENIKQTETQSDASDTKPEKLSELEQKIEDFKKQKKSKTLGISLRITKSMQFRRSQQQSRQSER